MNDLKKAFMEHLKTKKKYNTLLLKYEIKCEELDNKTVELNTEKRIHLKRQEIWEKMLKEQEKEIIRLKKRKTKNGVDSKKK